MDETTPAAPAGASRPVHHLPKHCKSCGGEVLWCQILGPDGKVKVRDPRPGPDGRPRDPRPKAMPVNFAPDATGNVVIYDRGGAIIARILRKGEQPCAGEQLRTAHGQTCPHRDDWKATTKARRAAP